MVKTVDGLQLAEHHLDETAKRYRDAIGGNAISQSHVSARRLAEDLYECMRQRRILATERLAETPGIAFFRPAQEHMDRVAIHCIDAIGQVTTRAELRRRLGNFLYGCLNQQVTIVDRVTKRGLGEIDQVMRFLARAQEFLEEI